MLMPTLIENKKSVFRVYFYCSDPSNGLSDNILMINFIVQQTKTSFILNVVI